MASRTKATARAKGENLENQLEHAIAELERRTDTLLATEFSDLLALADALEHRADAITKVALVVESETDRAGARQAVERLAALLVRGEEATRRMFRVKQQTAEDWSRANRARRGLEAAVGRPAGKVNCVG
jgi:hypothetical protein